MCFNGSGGKIKWNIGIRGKRMIEEKSTKKRILFNVIMTLLLFTFLITAATFIVLSVKPLYYAMIRWFDISKESGYSVDEIKANYDVLIDYNMFWGPDKLRFATFPMSEHADEIRARIAELKGAEK